MEEDVKLKYVSINVLAEFEPNAKNVKNVRINYDTPGETKVDITDTEGLNLCSVAVKDDDEREVEEVFPDYYEFINKIEDQTVI